MFALFKHQKKFEELRKSEDTVFRFLPDDDQICARIQVEAMYENALAFELAEIEEVKRQEALRIPTDIDYENLNLNLSNEEKERLVMTRPQTVSLFFKLFIQIFILFSVR